MSASPSRLQSCSPRRQPRAPQQQQQRRGGNNSWVWLCAAREQRGRCRCRGSGAREPAESCRPEHSAVSGRETVRNGRRPSARASRCRTRVGLLRRTTTNVRGTTTSLTRTRARVRSRRRAWRVSNAVQCARERLSRCRLGHGHGLHSRNRCARRDNKHAGAPPVQAQAADRRAASRPGSLRDHGAQKMRKPPAAPFPRLPPHSPPLRRCGAARSVSRSRPAAATSGARRRRSVRCGRSPRAWYLT